MAPKNAGDQGAPRRSVMFRSDGHGYYGDLVPCRKLYTDYKLGFTHGSSKMIQASREYKEHWRLRDVRSV